MFLEKKSFDLEVSAKVDKIVIIIVIIYCAFEIAYALGLLRTRILLVYPGTFRSLVLAIILISTFILRPGRRGAPRDKIPWWDYLLIAASLPGPIYMAWAYVELIPIHPYFATPFEQVLGVLTSLAVLEATRRTVGWTIALLALIFVCYAMFGSHLPGFLHTKKFTLDVIIAEIFLFPNGMFGFLLNIAAIMLFMFIMFGAFLQVTGGGDFLIATAMAVVGRFRGGPAKVAVIASCFMGTMSGSAVANVAVTGSMTIPLMKKTGFKAHYAAAIEAVASTGGMFMPPIMGAVAFVMAEVLGIAYIEVVIAATLPAVLYYLGIFAMLDFQAAKTGIRGMPRGELPRLGSVVRKGWPFMLPLPALVYFLTTYSEVTACTYALIVLLMGAMIKKETRLTPKIILSGLKVTVDTMITIIPAIATVGIILGCISMTGLGISLSSGLVDFAHGNKLFLLILAAAASFIMGMGLTATVCYILLATLVAPALTTMGVPAIGAHLFMLYWGILFMITPPVALAVYVASGIAKAPMMKTGFQAMRLGIVAYIVPFMWIYKPVLLMRGSPADIAVTIITSAIGVIALGGAIEGYMLTKASTFQRLVLGIAAVFLIMPGSSTDLLGGALLTLLILLQWRAARKVPT
jgi:TRAP transporter 4TM/12TM fusion protein